MKRMYRLHPMQGYWQSTLAEDRMVEMLQQDGWSDERPEGFMEGHTPEQAARVRPVDGVTVAGIATVTSPTRMGL